MSTTSPAAADALVPDSVIPHGKLPPLRWRDMPEPVPLRKMIGPSIMLAGLALGSGEFVIWPYITTQIGFTFFWACVLGVATQYFINMEITRWALVTGESAVTGFARLSRHWAWVLLVLNVVPWMIPAWSVGAAELIGWLVWEPTVDAATGRVVTPYTTPLAIAGLVMCGIILTAGPVIYETVERIQMVLVSLILLLVVVLAVLLVRPDAVAALARGSVSFTIPDSAAISGVTLLGALAFAGVGGTLNLGQSNYVKEKGYGMGRYIGRITSPITGKDEPVAEIGYHFPATEENLARWRQWWRAANIEHFLTFFLTCMLCLVLLSLIAYCMFFDEQGAARPQLSEYGSGMGFVRGEAIELRESHGPLLRVLFLVMGVAILLTTEFGVLDAASRISTDIVKVNWLRHSMAWTESRLYYLFLWGTILLGVALMAVVGSENLEGLTMFKVSSAMNGAVMFLYCGALLYLNFRRLPPAVRMSLPRAAVMLWAVLFFGFFTGYAAWGLATQWLG